MLFRSGVKDNGKIAGIRSDEEYYMIEAASEMYCDPKVDFEAKEWNLDGKIILEVKVQSQSNKPHKAPDKDNKMKTYIRIADENILAPETIALAWKKQSMSKGRHIKISKPVEKLLTYLNSNPYISTGKFQQIARVKHRTAQNILSDLLAIGSLEYLLEDKQIVYRINKINTENE